MSAPTKTMKLKDAEKVTKVIAEIKELDADIVKLEALAIQAANGDSNVTVQFSIEDLVAKEQASAKVRFDEDGSIEIPRPDNTVSILNGLRFSFGGCDGAPKKETHKTSMPYDVPDTIALQLFGLLIGWKQELRQQKMNSLKKFGII